MSPVLVLSYEIFHVSGSEQTCCRQYRGKGGLAIGIRQSARTKGNCSSRNKTALISPYDPPL